MKSLKIIALFVVLAVVAGSTKILLTDMEPKNAQNGPVDPFQKMYPNFQEIDSPPSLSTWKTFQNSYREMLRKYVEQQMEINQLKAEREELWMTIMSIQ